MPTGSRIEKTHINLSQKLDERSFKNLSRESAIVCVTIRRRDVRQDAARGEARRRSG
jgi:hypothetical protein